MATAGPPSADPSPSTPEQPSARGNPLARSTDRTESAVVLLLIGLWVLALPVVVICGLIWFQHLSAVVADQQSSRTSVVAVTLTDAPAVVTTERGVPLDDLVPVEAHWRGNTGAQFTGTVLAPAGAAAGSAQAIWIDRHGALTEVPLDSTGAAVTVLLSVSGLWLCWGGLLYGGRMTLRQSLNRQRMAEWDTEWLQVEPRWSGRHPAP